MAMARCVSFWWLALPSRARNNFTVKLQTYNCIVLTDFQHTKLYSFQPWVIIFLKFCKLQPRYSYKIYCYRKQKSVHICYSPAGRSVLGETVPEVLSTASGGTQTEGTVSPSKDRPRPVNNIFIFFLLRFKSLRKIFLHSPTYTVIFKLL